MTAAEARRRRSIPGLGALFRAFLAGLAFLAPVLLTAIVLAWVFGQLLGLVGPDSLVGRALTAGGNLLTGREANPLFSFAVGVALLVAGITALGWWVKGRAEKYLVEAVDGAIGRIPFLGGVYRPVAQIVRGMGGDRSEEMSRMAACRVRFGGGIEAVAFLASPETFDLGGGPAKLVLIPTAPVPVGGALLLVPSAQVELIPAMKVEDLAKLYLTMGVSPPPALPKAAPVSS